MPTRLVLVDGQTLARYGLRQFVARHSDIEIVAECPSTADAQRVIATIQPDVVTVEVKLPDGDGLRLARELRDRYADLGIVILASQQEDDVLFQALETGVSAFVAMTAPLEEVLAAIRHAAVAATSFTASGLATALARHHAVQDRLTLSHREREILHLLRDGLSIPAIAMTMFMSQSTAKTHVARLYDKLGAANRAQALMTAMHRGLIDYQQKAPSPVPFPGAQARLRRTARSRDNRLGDNHHASGSTRALEHAAAAISPGHPVGPGCFRRRWPQCARQRRVQLRARGGVGQGNGAERGSDAGPESYRANMLACRLAELGEDLTVEIHNPPPHSSENGRPQPVDPCAGFTARRGRPGPGGGRRARASASGAGCTAARTRRGRCR
jgi:DNA-binding NarL/FixJ family response regulator